MLESILQKFRGIVLGLMVLSLSAIFILQFGGPQAEGCSKGAGQTYAAEVYGDNISVNEYRSAFALAGGDNYPPEYAKQHQLDHMVLRGLVERALLVRQAKALGMNTDPEDVMHKIAEDGVVHMSMSVDAGPYLPPAGPRRFDFKDQAGKFNKDNLRKFIQYRLRRSVEEFANEQSDETLAQNMRDSVTAQVTLSPNEVWDAFVREKESVTLKYARFSPVFYGQALEPTAAELASWSASHASDIDAEYEREKHRYTGLEKQVRARHILIKLDEKATEAQQAEAKTKADGLAARARKGEDFAQLAKQYSEDQGSAKKGGDLGFNPKGRMVKEFDDAQFSLATGAVSDPVKSPFGYHVIKVEGVREGDVPVAEAKSELALKLYRTQRASELAKTAADAALAELKGGDSFDAVNAKLAGGPGKEADPLAPQFRDTQAFSRTDTPIAGPFDGSPLVQAAFEMDEAKPLPEAPIKLGDEYVVYRLEQHVRVKRDDLTDKDKQRIHDGLLNRKRHEVLTVYVRDLVREAEEAKAVFVDERVLSPEANPGNS
ncbi:MAG TPA: peptidylprolyl isomerase [Polyangiales bacterium]|nr:peptidylprolyl isomerase [Polyangiales bacterium]